jgi:hypothetical protein
MYMDKMSVDQMSVDQQYVNQMLQPNVSWLNFF